MNILTSITIAALTALSPTTQEKREPYPDVPSEIAVLLTMLAEEGGGILFHEPAGIIYIVQIQPISQMGISTTSTF